MVMNISAENPAVNRSEQSSKCNTASGIFAARKLFGTVFGPPELVFCAAVSSFEAEIILDLSDFAEPVDV
jgi:hypothetical protein